VAAAKAEAEKKLIGNEVLGAAIKTLVYIRGWVGGWVGGWMGGWVYVCV